MEKARFLLLDTDFTCEEVKGYLEDGYVILKDGVYLLDKSKPLEKKFKKGLFGKSEPFYILKWNSLIPLNLKLEEKQVEFGDKKYLYRTLEPIDLKFTEWYQQKGKDGKMYSILPKALKAYWEMEFLKGLGKYPEVTKKPKLKKFLQLLPFILIIVGGMFLAYLMMSGVFKL